MELLNTLISTSQKAANIARILRENGRTFTVLVENKASSNSKYKHDYKTLGDVLIQNMIKRDIIKNFPSLENKVHGEENEFLYYRDYNKKGIQKLEIEIKPTESEMTEFLLKITYHNPTAEAISKEIFKSVDIKDVNTQYFNIEFPLDINNINIWIDPIDGTNQYVNMLPDKKQDQFYIEGLGCVTVLIGAYNNDGKPIIGVINQPFHNSSDVNQYQCYCGVDIPGINKGSIIPNKFPPHKLNQYICVTEKEDKSILDALEKAGFKLVYPKGAGYKILNVIIGLVDAYVVSKPTTYYWDTCGPHAILKSLGGNIISAKDLFQKKIVEINYKESEDHCNSKGIIAYQNEDIVDRLLNIEWPEEYTKI